MTSLGDDLDAPVPDTDDVRDPVEPTDAVTPETAEGDKPGMSPSTRSALEWAAVVICALAVALVVKTFLLQAFYIPSGSMLPTLAEGDRVLVNKLDDTPTRGEIIVFERPDGPDADGIKDLIKRTIGLPGETIEGRDGAIYIDGVRLEEPYLPADISSRTFPPTIVSDGHVFVLGDNRQDSTDSTKFGEIPIDTIVGRAFVVIWPPGSVGGL